MGLAQRPGFSLPGPCTRFSEPTGLAEEWGEVAALFSAGVGIAHPLNLFSFFLSFFLSFLLFGDGLLCDPLIAAPRLGPAAPRGKKVCLSPSHTVMFLLINPVLLTMALSHSTTASRAFEVT